MNSKKKKKHLKIALVKHVHPKTISSRSHKLKNTIPSKEVEDSSLVDQAYLEPHPHGGGRRFFSDGPKHI